MRSFDVNNETIAVVLRKPSTGPRLYEVRTLDGSTWIGASLAIDDGHIVLRERSLGIWKIPFHEVIEVRRTARAG